MRVGGGDIGHGGTDLTNNGEGREGYEDREGCEDRVG